MRGRVPKQGNDGVAQPLNAVADEAEANDGCLAPQAEALRRHFADSLHRQRVVDGGGGPHHILLLLRGGERVH